MVAISLYHSWLVHRFWILTKYVVGAKANPPKNPSKAPKYGNAMARTYVVAK